MKATSTSAAPQARVKDSGFASSESVKIVTGMFGTAVPGSRLKLDGSNTEQAKISGAVSPAARAIARTVEVTMPPGRAGQDHAEHRPASG